MSERWKQIERLYQAALELEPAARAAFLDEACAGDEELRGKVASRLANSPSRIGGYQILSLLGRGGMGEVWLAHDPRLGRNVAIKLLPAKFTQDAGRVRRFEQEARMASSLNHPNIITIHEIGETNGVHYIATEFIDGQTLRDRLTREKLALSVALDVTIQTASALVAAHDAGIIHRDIKPENVMLRRDGYVKVLDFGLAKLTEQRLDSVDSQTPTLARADTDPGTVLGTVSYMSPEQARGLTVNAGTDIFSLGVVLYEMIAGRRPFEGQTTMDVLAAILDREPAPLKQRRADTPAELQRIVSKALRKNRDERYQTMKDLQLDLKSLRQEIEFETKLREQMPEETIAQTASPDVDVTQAIEPPRVTSQSSQPIDSRKRSILFILLVAIGIVGLSFVIYSLRPARNSTISTSPADSTATHSNTQVRSIAVLPFKPLVADHRDESLEMGMADTLITRLNKLSQIIVRPISAVRVYARLDQDPVQAGKEQRVDAVLDGSLQRAGDRIRVTVRLVSVPDGTPLWADKFDEKFSDIFGVQDSISEQVAATLALKLSGDEKNQLSKRYTRSPEAYQLYLKGRYYWSRRTEDGMKKAMEHFQSAIDLDPAYALAYVGIGDCYAWLALGSMSPMEAVPKAKAAANKALEIDDHLAEVHPLFAWILFTYDWDWPGAEKEFKRSIELNPNYATAHLWYWAYLERQGRFDEAQRETKKTLDLDPISLVNNSFVGRSLYYAGQYDQAIGQYDKTLEMDSTFPLAQTLLGLAYLQQSRFKEAIALGEKTAAFRGGSIDAVACLGYAYAMSGNRPGATKILEHLAEQSKLRYVSPLNAAIVYLGLGDNENALHWLERGYAERTPDLTTIKVDPIFKSLRSEPRFTDLLRRIGLGG